jgi:hypothetical protein
LVFTGLAGDASGFRLRAGGKIRLGCTGLWLHWVSGYGRGVELGWCLPGCGCIGCPVTGGGSNWVGMLTGRGRVGFPVAGRGSKRVGVHRVVVASGFRLRAGGQIGLVLTGLWSHWVSDYEPGVELGWYVPGHVWVWFPVTGGGSNWVGKLTGRGRVGFPVAGRGSKRVGVHRVEVALVFWLRAGGRIGLVCTTSWSHRASAGLGSDWVGDHRVVVPSGVQLLTGGRIVGWYVLGRSCPGHPVAAGGSNLVGMDRAVGRCPDAGRG